MRGIWAPNTWGYINSRTKLGTLRFLNNLMVGERLDSLNWPRPFLPSPSCTMKPWLVSFQKTWSPWAKAASASGELTAQSLTHSRSLKMNKVSRTPAGVDKRLHKAGTWALCVPWDIQSYLQKVWAHSVQAEPGTSMRQEVRPGSSTDLHPHRTSLNFSQPRFLVG